MVMAFSKKIEELKKKLSSEGIFDNKKEIPKFPEKCWCFNSK